MANCWILCTARTGSTFLSSLLNETRLFPGLFREWLPDFKTVEQFKENTPCCAKVLRSQFCELFGDQERLAESLIPNLRYILLRRKNVVAQAVSFYVAKNLGQFSLNVSECSESYFEKNLKLSEDDLLRIHHYFKEKYTIWDKYLSNSEYLEVEYENLVKNPHKTLENILTYFEVTHDPSIIKFAISNCTVLPTTRPESSKLIDFISERYG